jgi:parallel beta-helix repeat protein
VDDSTFVVAINSNNALVSTNKISFTGSGNGTAILDFGGNQNLRITGNSITGGADPGTTGIKLADFAGSASVGTTVSKNKVTGRYWGIRLSTSSSPYTTALVSNNTVTGSAATGILVEAGSNNVFTTNHIAGSAVHDCQDLTSGTNTFGTANNWHGNKGKSSNSSPAGIC